MSDILPAGVYPARILACDPHDFAKGGQGFRFRFKPTEPTLHNIMHTEWLAFEYEPGFYLDRGLRMIQEIWYGCGNEGLWQDAQFAAATLTGQECAIKLSVRDDTRTPDAKQNRLEGVWALNGTKYKAPKAPKTEAKKAGFTAQDFLLDPPF